LDLFAYLSYQTWFDKLVNAAVFTKIVEYAIIVIMHEWEFS